MLYLKPWHLALVGQPRPGWVDNSKLRPGGREPEPPPCPLLPDISSILFQLPPRGPCSPWGMSWEVVDDLSINLSAWGLMVRWRLSGPCSCQMGLPEPVGEGGGAEGVPAAGPGGCLTIPGPSQPLPPPSLATPWAAFFTTSGYRALHEFRSQWNYFRILVNRKLRVFHKLSITAVRWAEHGLGASNGFERPRPLPGGGGAPPLAAPRPLQADGLCFTSPPPTNLAGIGFRLGLRRDRVWLDPDMPELCSHHGLRSTGLLSLIKGGCGPRALPGLTRLFPSLSWR